jgi:hypothetical protein
MKLSAARSGLASCRSYIHSPQGRDLRLTELFSHESKKVHTGALLARMTEEKITG